MNVLPRVQRWRTRTRTARPTCRWCAGTVPGRSTRSSSRGPRRISTTVHCTSAPSATSSSDTSAQPSAHNSVFPTHRIGRPSRVGGPGTYVSDPIPRAPRAIDPSPLPKNRILDPRTFDAAVAAHSPITSSPTTSLPTHGTPAWVDNQVLGRQHLAPPAGGTTPWQGQRRRRRDERPAVRRGGVREGEEARSNARSPTFFGPRRGLYVRTEGRPKPVTERQGTRSPRSHLGVRGAPHRHRRRSTGSGTSTRTSRSAWPTPPARSSPGRTPPRRSPVSQAAVIPRGGSGDRAYTHTLADDFQSLSSMGYEPSSTTGPINSDQESLAGALMIEGAWYCPAIPSPSSMRPSTTGPGASTRPRGRTASRHARAYRSASKATHDGKTKMMSPRPRHLPHGTCELKPELRTPEERGKTRIPVTTRSGQQAQDLRPEDRRLPPTSRAASCTEPALRIERVGRHLLPAPQHHRRHQRHREGRLPLGARRSRTATRPRRRRPKPLRRPSPVCHEPPKIASFVAHAVVDTDGVPRGGPQVAEHHQGDPAGPR